MKLATSLRRFCAPILVFVCLAGCTDVPAELPTYDSADAVSAAFAEYDANSDGSIDAAELAKSPGLKAARVDGNGDGLLGKDELQTRIESYARSSIAVMPLRCMVTLNGAALEGAEVRLIPEKFLGDQIKPGKGTTDALGIAVVSAEGLAEGVVGVNLGIYRVEISKKDTSGREVVPAKYNGQTILGQEMAMDIQELERGVKYALSSR